MTAVLVSTADAVTAALNDAPEGTFSKRFAAERSYADWEIPLSDQEKDVDVRVDVVPVGQLDTEIETGATIKYMPATDILIRRRLGPERRQAGGKFDLEELDELVLFVEEINEFFAIDRLPDFEDAAWDSETGTKILAAYKPSHLRQLHQFTGIVRVPFRTCKAIS